MFILNYLDKPKDIHGYLINRSYLWTSDSRCIVIYNDESLTIRMEYTIARR